MGSSPRFRPSSLGSLAALAFATTACAVVIFQTNGPFGGFFGLWGMDLSTQQSAAARVSPTGEYTFTRAKVWLMNNSSSMQPMVNVRLELDAVDLGLGGASRPSGIALEEWDFPIATLGWNPVQQTVTSKLRPALRAGRKYWIVASSPATPGANPVWNFASSGNAFTGVTQLNGSWSTGSGAALTIVVEGDVGAPLKGDVDRDGAIGASDLALLLDSWGSTQPAAGLADVDQNGVVEAADLSLLLVGWTG
jgi:hypothetical protein